ncbi:MAG: DUF1761 domain-containing protein [Paracoccaceae bacterium]
MGILAVILAALAAYVFGAIWYMVMAKQWMEAAGLKEGDINRTNPVPYLIGAVAVILVAGMMRHIFFESNVAGVANGLKNGLGLGLFIATPWIATNYAFSGRPMKLTLVDGLYATIGCTLMGVVLGYFAAS